MSAGAVGRLSCLGASGGLADGQHRRACHAGPTVSRAGGIGCYSEDPAVAVRPADTGRQHRGVDVVELHVQRLLRDREGAVKPAVGDPEVNERAQGLAGDSAQLGMIPIALELTHDDQREYDVVFGRAGQGSRVGEQNGGVEHERGHGVPCARHLVGDPDLVIRTSGEQRLGGFLRPSMARTRPCGVPSVGA